MKINIKYLLLIISSALIFMNPSSAIFPQERGLDVVAAPIVGQSNIGKQIAVFIAIDNYKEWPDLRKPVSDAESLRKVLENRYYIDQSIMLYNGEATKAGVMKLFEQLISEARPEDSIFIYYAGHGYFDSLSGIGSWILADSGTDRYEQRNWLDNPKIRNLIGRINSRHVLLISDSCFSGDIINPNRGEIPDISNSYFRTAYMRRSRQVISSGASEYVPDESMFTNALIKYLEENNQNYVDPLMIYNNIRLSQLSTLPLLGSLKDTDSQDGGSFILFLKQQPAWKVIYNDYGATNGSSPIDNTAYHSGQVAIVADRGTLSRKDYTFEGWNTKPDATGDFYHQGDSLIIRESNIMLYPAWKLVVPPATLLFSYLPQGTIVYLDSKEIFHATRQNTSYMGSIATGMHELRYNLAGFGDIFSFQETVVADSDSLVKSKAVHSAMVDFYEGQKQKAREYKKKSQEKTISLIIGGAGLAMSAASYLLGQKAYEMFRESVTPEDAAKYRSQIQTWRIVFPVSLAIGGGGLIAVPFIRLPHVSSEFKKMPIKAYIEEIDETIQRLNQSL